MPPINILILFLSIILTACFKQSETIIPIAEVKTLAQIQLELMKETAVRAGNSELSNDSIDMYEASQNPGLFYLNIKYKLKKIDILKAANMPNAFEQVGNSFMRTIANIILSIKGTQNVELSDFDWRIPEVDLDEEIVKSLKITRIEFNFSETKNTKADFSFIETLELEREIMAANRQIDTIFLSYRKTRNNCKYKCLQFDIMDGNILDSLKNQTHIRLRPSLSINKLPNLGEIILDGVIEMQIGLKLPF